jgi:glycosyltransferase involved in cell wall biosynthesis
MFGTTLEGALACPERTILVPCLHDEAYAYFESFRRMFLAARGSIFHAPAEAALAQRLYALPEAKSFIVGGGIDAVTQANAQRFHQKYKVGDFLLYAGRKDEAKNVPLLIRNFCAYKDRFPSDLKLLLIGNGQLPIPKGHAGHDVIDLGFVSRQDKHDAYAAALALCQPSIMESFSIVALEAWSAGTPALVHGDCEVTREHCELSQGGLWFRSFGEFAGALRFFEHNRDMRDRMGRNGQSYVQKNFQWASIVQKYEDVFRELGFKLHD